MVQRIIQLPRKGSQSSSTTTIHRETAFHVCDVGRFGLGCAGYLNRKTFDTIGETLKHRGQFRTENEYGNAKWLSTPFRANPHSWRLALFFWLRQTDRKALLGIGVPVRVPGRSGCAHPTDERRIDFAHRRAGNQRRRKIVVATERVVWPVAADL